jgi:GDPmannose 4,6-dehydratase
MIFSKLDMNYEDYVKINPKFIRPEELNYLCGDSSKAKKVLGWKPEYSFESMVDEILEHFLKNS